MKLLQMIDKLYEYYRRKNLILKLNYFLHLETFIKFLIFLIIFLIFLN